MVNEAGRKLLLATHNPGKVVEYCQLLVDVPLTITTLDNEGVTQEVEETSTTFEENARIKAETYAQLSAMITLG